MTCLCKSLKHPCVGLSFGHSPLSIIFSYIFLAVNLQGTTFLSLLLMALLLLVFAISGAEVALFSLTNKDINMLKTKQHAACKRIITLLEEPKDVMLHCLLHSQISLYNIWQSFHYQFSLSNQT